MDNVELLQFAEKVFKDDHSLLPKERASLAAQIIIAASLMGLNQSLVEIDERLKGCCSYITGAIMVKKID